MAPNLDPFGRDRAAYQEHSRQRRIAEREARRCDTHLSLSVFCVAGFFTFLHFGHNCFLVLSHIQYPCIIQLPMLIYVVVELNAHGG